MVFEVRPGPRLRALGRGGLSPTNKQGLWLPFIPNCSEDADARLFLRVAGAFHHVLEDGGVDIAHGRGFYPMLLAQGLANVQVDGNMQVWLGGSAGALLWRANIEQLRTRLVGDGFLSEDEVERFGRLVEDPGSRSKLVRSGLWLGTASQPLASARVMQSCKSAPSPPFAEGHLCHFFRKRHRLQGSPSQFQQSATAARARREGWLTLADECLVHFGCDLCAAGGRDRGVLTGCEWQPATTRLLVLDDEWGLVEDLDLRVRVVRSLPGAQ